MTLERKLVSSQWITVSPSRGNRKGRIFCLPFAGGGASAYHRWPSRVLDGIEVARVNLPGRETRLREPLFDRLAPLIDALVKELVLWIDGPFFLFGHSMGALLVFELARALRCRHGLLPLHLFVSGFRAPHLPPSHGPFSHLPDSEFVESVRRYGGLPDLVAQNEELLEIFLPILRADFSMIEKYVYLEESPLECPITALGGLADSEVSCEEILAWNLHTSARFNVHLFPGGHFFLHNSEPLVFDQINHQLNGAMSAG